LLEQSLKLKVDNRKLDNPLNKNGWKESVAAKKGTSMIVTYIKDNLVFLNVPLHLFVMIVFMYTSTHVGTLQSSC
jgi:hypothetical protein